jgi:esterase
LTINGRRHHYLEWGSPAQPALVLLHGGNSSARGTWTRLAPAFANAYHILAPDHRGHGETDWDPDAGYTIGNYVADFEEFVQQVGVETFDLVGHSLGGMIALTYASRHPERVRRLVLVDSGPRDFGTADALRMRMPDRPMSFASREEAEAFARAGFPDAAQERSVSYGFIQRTDGSWTWRADVAGLQRARTREDGLRAGGLWAEFAAINCPILIVRGGKSPALSDETSRRIEAANPRVCLITYAEAHHWVHDDEPERFVSDLATFLEDRLG